MSDFLKVVCPIPYLGYCIYERCNYWDEDKQECSGLCIGDYDSLEETGSPQPNSPCTIYWTEDSD